MSGNMGNMGNAFYVSPSSSTVVPDRIELPLMEEEARKLKFNFLTNECIEGIVKAHVKAHVKEEAARPKKAEDLTQALQYLVGFPLTDEQVKQLREGLLPRTKEEFETPKFDGLADLAPLVSGAELKGLPNMPNASWAPRDWDGHWTAWRVLDGFSQKEWRTEKLTLWDTDENKIEDELNLLTQYAEDERADALSEIVAQDAFFDRFAVYFMRLLRITATSHPHTCTLLQVAGLVGLMATMHYKAVGDGTKPRVRPSQLRPALMPPVEVPGHPSFPSGHAMQSMFMALLLLAAMPAEKQERWKPLLQTLALRMGRNRELAGLHYPSDTRGGVELAIKMFPYLLGSPHFHEVLEAAKAEWR